MGGRSEEPVIRVEGLGTEIGGYWIHQNLDLEVRRDEILAVMGASGSGKSVLLRQIAGLMEPSRGRVLVMGQDIHRISPATLQGLRRKWGILFQDGALFSAFNLFDNVAFPLREMIRYGASLDADTVNDLVWNALATVKLTPQDGYKTPGQISDGMSKRAALARALVMEPDLLLLDEPTAGLDPILSRNFIDLLADLREEYGFTGLVISHDLNALASFGDRFAVLAEKRILAQGSLEEVAKVDHPFVRGLFTSTRGQQRVYRLSESVH